MGILEKIKDIEDEMARTQKNKATEHHFGLMKARLAKLRSQLLEPPKTGGKKEGFDVEKQGHARIALVGYPSVGKSTMLNRFTGQVSEVNEKEFTTLTCIPGILYHKDCKIQMLDLPGIIEGASEGKGNGRQVIACAKSADLILIVLDAVKYKDQLNSIMSELELVGIRINRDPPDITVKPTKGGGVKISSTVKLTKLTTEVIRQILHEFRVLNGEIMIRGDYTVDDLIDVMEGNRRYIKGLYIYNKVDMISMEEIDELARKPNSLIMSCEKDIGTEYFLEKMWEYLDLIRVYTKKKGELPDFEDPVVLRKNRGGFSIKNAVTQIHAELLNDFQFASVWGRSVKYSPMKCGLSHELCDEDVIQIHKKN